MVDSDIDANVNAMREAIVNDDEATAQQKALQLLAQFLKDIHRIADALASQYLPRK